MKNFLQISAILWLLVLSSCVPPQHEVPDDETVVSYQEFYDELSPYGHWVQHPAYGYVWIPEAGPDFVPYSTAGYWVWTDSYGWAWASDYQWGWAPFHYGRWNFSDDYGWYWVPDLVWGPAWVAWREYPGYYGWCPLGPGIGVELAFNGSYLPPDYWWTDCDRRYFGSRGRDMHDHFERGGRVGRIRGGESRAIDNTIKDGGMKHGGFPAGPSKEDVQAATGVPITPVKIVHSTRPGESLQGNNWSIYRPQVEKISTAQVQPAPRSLTTPRDIYDVHESAKPLKERRPYQPPVREESRQNPSIPRTQPAHEPAPRQQPVRESAPREQSVPREAPHQQSMPRGNESSGKSNPK